jgi:hypothetical protein
MMGREEEGGRGPKEEDDYPKPEVGQELFTS